MTRMLGFLSAAWAGTAISDVASIAAAQQRCLSVDWRSESHVHRPSVLALGDVYEEQRRTPWPLSEASGCGGPHPLGQVRPSAASQCDASGACVKPSICFCIFDRLNEPAAALGG